MGGTLIENLATGALWISLSAWLPALLALAVLIMSIVLLFSGSGRGKGPPIELFTADLQKLSQHTTLLGRIPAAFEALAAGEKKGEPREALLLQNLIDCHRKWIGAVTPLLAGSAISGLEMRQRDMKGLLDEIRSLTGSGMSQDLESRLSKVREGAVSDAVRISDQDLGAGEKRALQALQQLVEAAEMQLVCPREGEIYRVGGIAKRVGKVRTRGLADQGGRIIREPEIREAL